jgi:pimeloyl-ACP methyl ester carboxylesterase
MPFAQAPGARLYYETTGSGTPIVFVHETLADLRSWEPQVRWFSRFNQCITFNARGYRPSERGSEPGTHDYRRLSDDIAVVMDAAGVQRAFVIGLSMGAYVAAHFALNHSERLLGVVLAGLGAGSDDPQAFRAGTLKMAAAVRGGGIERLAQELTQGHNREQLRRKDPRGWAELVQQVRGQDAEGIANILEHCHSRRPSIYESETALRALRVPTLIAVGDEDTPCIQPALFLKRCIPGSGLWVCPHTGHAINLEESVLFNAAVESFIRAVQANNRSF